LGKQDLSKRRFIVVKDSDTNKKGSLLCYPIFEDKLKTIGTKARATSLLGVLCIHCPTCGIFKDEEREWWEARIRPFADRLKFEILEDMLCQELLSTMPNS
jgi:hypothetical protein